VLRRGIWLIFTLLQVDRHLAGQDAEDKVHQDASALGSPYVPLVSLAIAPPLLSHSLRAPPPHMALVPSSLPSSFLLSLLLSPIFFLDDCRAQVEEARISSILWEASHAFINTSSVSPPPPARVPCSRFSLSCHDTGGMEEVPMYCRRPLWARRLFKARCPKQL